jgi:hypothetical protein
VRIFLRTYHFSPQLFGSFPSEPARKRDREIERDIDIENHKDIETVNVPFCVLLTGQKKTRLRSSTEPNWSPSEFPSVSERGSNELTRNREGSRAPSELTLLTESGPSELTPVTKMVPVAPFSSLFQGEGSLCDL